ncbi:MAG TPA: hypothetical protein VJY34_21925 [Roseiarcus sp.]|nr:hypothetical protein [Roseiarcus sp.]
MALQVLGTGLQLFAAGNNVKPNVIGTVIVLPTALDAYRDRFLKAIEALSRVIRPAALAVTMSVTLRIAQ